MALDRSNSSSLEQLVLTGLTFHYANAVDVCILLFLYYLQYIIVIIC